MKRVSISCLICLCLAGPGVAQTVVEPPPPAPPPVTAPAPPPPPAAPTPPLSPPGVIVTDPASSTAPVVISGQTSVILPGAASGASVNLGGGFGGIGGGGGMGAGTGGIGPGAGRPGSAPSSVAGLAQSQRLALEVSFRVAAAECGSGDDSCAEMLQVALSQATASELPASARISIAALGVSRVITELPPSMPDPLARERVSGAIGYTMLAFRQIIDTTPRSERRAALAFAGSAVDTIGRAVVEMAADRPAMTAQIVADAVDLVGRLAPLSAADRIRAASSLATRAVFEMTNANVSPVLFSSSMTIIMDAAATAIRAEASRATPRETEAVAFAVENAAFEMRSVANSARERYSGWPEVLAAIDSVTTAVIQSVRSIPQLSAPLTPTVPVITVTEASPT